MKPELIHYCCKEEKPIVYINCLNWGGYGGDNNETYMEEVYDADFDDNLFSVFYTKNKNKVTCKHCLQNMP